jgi:peroxiredoxin
MALTESNMMPLGTLAPDFSLFDTISGKTLTFNTLASEKATVVMFICNHCPYVLHINKGIVALEKEFSPLGVSFIGISSNDAVKYPADSPERMTQHAAEVGYNFPYLFDESQDVARAYDAACTPEFYVFDGAQKLAYRGRLDASRPKNQEPVTGSDLRAALLALLAGQNPDPVQFVSAGCNIKWKTNP